MRATPLVLLADDDPTLRRMLAMVLVRSGYEVVEAADGRQAVELAEQHRPDLLLMDIHMPVMTGLDALRAIRSSRAAAGGQPGQPGQLGQPPAVILSAMAQRNDVIAAARAGADYFIAKSGFHLNDFLIRIRDILAKSGNGEKAKAASWPPHSINQPVLGSARAMNRDREPLPPSRACFLRDAANLAELAGHTPPIVPGELAQQVGKITQVRALPFVLPHVLALTASHYSSAESLTDAIQQDVGLTSKVLAMANSSIYRRDRDPVTSLGQAVRNIGFGSVRQAALGLGVMDLFPHPQADSAAGIDRVAFWEHSFASGSIARLLAGRIGGMDESLAFVVGLLHSIGRLIFDDFFAAAHAELLALYRSDKTLPFDLERRWMGMDHAHLAEAVLGEWHMPDEFCQPIGDHRLPLAAMLDKPELRRRWAGLVKLSDHLATCLGLGDRRACHLSHVDNEFVDEFAVDDDFLLDLRDAIPAQLREMKMMMLLYLPKARLAERTAPVSHRPLLYLCPATRTPHVDLIQYYLRLRHSRVETFTDPAAFALRIESLSKPADSQPAAVVNLLPATAVDRTAALLDPWARVICGDADRPAGCQSRSPGRPGRVVLARPNQVEQLTGPFGQAFDGLLSPVPVAQLDKLVASG